MDPYCFFRREHELWVQQSGHRKDLFDPQPCTYILLRHPDDFSEPEVAEGCLQEEDVLPFIQKPCTTGFHGEVRVIFTVERRLLPAPKENRPSEYREIEPWPFSPETYLGFIENCGFFSASGGVRQANLATSKIAFNGKTALSLLVNYLNPHSFMRILVSRDELLGTTTIIVHNTLPGELKYIRSLFDNVSFQRLSLHPVLIFTICIGMLYNHHEDWIRRTALENAGPLVASIPKLNAGETEAENENTEKDSAKALARQYASLQQLWNLQEIQITLDTLKSWCRDFNQTASTAEQQEVFKTTSAIIENRLVYMKDRLSMAELSARTVLSATQAYKQSLEIRNATINNKFNMLISSQSRDIARASKRDSSAMKAIALLTMFFLPGTFVAAFFAMPLFNWDAASNSSIVHSRFWIYWAVTVPATAIVLVLWRMWFKFDEWRATKGEVGSLYRDVALWLRSRRPASVYDDGESGTSTES